MKEKIEKMMRMDEINYKRLKKLAFELDISISTLIKLIFFWKIKELTKKEKELLEKKEVKNEKLNKRILLYLEKYEFDYIINLAQEFQYKNFTTIIKDIIVITFAFYNENEIKKAVQKYNEIYNLSKIDLKLITNNDLYEKLNNLTKKSGLNIDDLIIKLLKSCSEEKILEKIKTN